MQTHTSSTYTRRAVKTTLNVAGGMLRADRQSSEERVLLRALRDFNMGKLVADDVSIFIGMIDDLFPKEREHVVRYECVRAANVPGFVRWIFEYLYGPG
jgi:hypothetical protein